MASSITLSLKLLQALITAGSPRDPFDPFFLSFLLRLSQSAGSTALKEQVKNALCFFVKDDSMATIQLTDLITSRWVYYGVFLVSFLPGTYIKMSRRSYGV